MAVYNWVDLFLGSVGFMQNCNACLYSDCKRVEIPIQNNDGKYPEEFARKLFDSCQALCDLSGLLAAKNYGLDFYDFPSRIISQSVTREGKHEIYIKPADFKADLLCATPRDGYLKVEIIDGCGLCQKDCTGRRRVKRQRPKLNPDCIKFAVWEAFVQKMRG